MPSLREEGAKKKRNYYSRLLFPSVNPFFDIAGGREKHKKPDITISCKLIERHQDVGLDHHS